jgi:DNA mismatch endonuclease (patch repair protein)
LEFNRNVDKLSPERRSANMSKIRAKDTLPEIMVRRLVHAMGYRYRLHRKDLPGRPDMAFGPAKKVIFVHGCFWHQHAECRNGRMPRSRPDYWQPKLRRNLERDAARMCVLTKAGWQVLVIWECELKDKGLIERTIRDFLDRGAHSAVRTPDWACAGVPHKLKEWENPIC